MFSNLYRNVKINSYVNTTYFETNELAVTLFRSHHASCVRQTSVDHPCSFMSYKRHFQCRHRRWHHPIWRYQQWRHPRHGAVFFAPHCGGGGARWRPFHFGPPSWMTSFPVTSVGRPAEMISSKMAAGSRRSAILHRRHNVEPKTISPILLTSAVISAELLPKEVLLL